MIQFIPHHVLLGGRGYDGYGGGYPHESYLPISGDYAVTSGMTAYPNAIIIHERRPEREEPVQIVERVVERVVEKTVIREVRVPQIQEKEKEQMSLTSISSILIIMAICIVTVKVVIPHLTLKNIAKIAVKLFIRLLLFPFRIFKKEFKKELKSADIDE